MIIENNKAINPYIKKNCLQHDVCCSALPKKESYQSYLSEQMELQSLTYICPKTQGTVYPRTKVLGKVPMATTEH
jgi:hypothetical protein